MIRIITVTNPIQPDRDRRIDDVEFTEATLKALLYLNALALGSPGYDESRSDITFDEWAAQVIVSVNGHVWARSLWTEVTPRDGDCIVIMPVVKGGSLLRTLASIALLAGTIALAATGAGAAFAGFLGSIGISGITTATATAILGGAVSIAGNLLISAVLGPNSGSDKSSSASYDPDGPKSLARSGVVIPKGYGTMVWGGNIISSFTDIAGNDQFINCLVCFGFGPARAITNIQINGKAISSYQNCAYFTRLGTNDQTELANFNRIVNGYPQNTQCLAGVPVVIPGTGDRTQALQVDIAMPSGLFVNTNDGNIIPAVITYLVEYAVSGTNDWQPVLVPQSTTPVTNTHPDGTLYLPHAWGVIATDLPPNSNVVYTLDDGPHNPGDPWTGTETVEVFAANGNHYTYSKTFQGEWQLLDINQNYVIVLTWSQGYQDFVAATTQPVYNRTNILGLAPGKYDVRITKYGCTRLHDDVPFGDNNSPNIGQDMWVHSVNEISLLDLAYPNMILVGIRALATSQLSGANINITAEIQHGLRTRDEGQMPTALMAYEEDNPACVAADMLLDPLYGGGAWPGIQTANIERFIDEWVAWAEANDQLVPDGNGNSIRLNVFNGVFDNEDNLWNQVNRVGQMSRAALMPMGLDYGVFVDGPVDAPVQMFTMGNILQDSFTETWLPIDDRANQVEVQFADATRYYKTDNPVAYMDPAQQDLGTVVKNTRIKALGVTSPAQAWHLARYKQRSNQFLLRTGSFRTDTDGIACRPGNVIALQHDVPQWGWGGRTLPGSTTTLILQDRTDLPFVTGTAYSLMVQHASVQRFSGTAGAVTTSTSPVGFTVALSGYGNTARATRAVINGTDCMILASAPGSITVSPPPSFVPANGQTCVVFDTDVMETVPVAYIDSVTGGIVVSTPLSQTPDDYSVYIYGPTGTVKLARVTRITKASELRSTIEWIDYDPDVYDVATPIIGETSAVITSNPGVTGLTGSEILVKTTGSYSTIASLAWRNGPDTVGVGIYTQTPGGTSLPQLLMRLTGSPTSQQIPIYPGTTTTFIVVGFDANNNYASITTAPSVTITAVGVVNNLLLGSSFETGFTYWNITPRAGDTFLPDLSNDGEAVYTVAGSTLTVAQRILYQVIPPAKWVVGMPLMLSGYIEDTAVGTANAGTVEISIVALNSSGAVISAQPVTVALNGTSSVSNLVRINTAVYTVPAGTTQLVVQVALNGTGLSLPVGSTVTMSHFLLEEATTGQTTPSAWVDVDVQGNVLDIFTGGSSTGLRVQGSVLPSFTGAISYTADTTSIVISWTSLVILWPDGASTYVQNAQMTVTGLTASTAYFAYLYFDIINGGVKAQVPFAAPAGTPGVLTQTADPLADAACRQDGRVALTVGGLSITTVSAGATGFSGSGGGGSGNPSRPITGAPLPPINSSA